MANSFALEEGTSSNQAAIHGYELRFSPEHVRFLSFSIQRLKVGIFIHQLRHNSNFEGIVSCLAQKVSIVSNHVGMILYLPKLLSLFLNFIKFIKCFSLDFLERIHLASRYMYSLVDLSIFFARAEDFQFLKVSFLEHIFILLT